MSQGGGAGGGGGGYGGGGGGGTYGLGDNPYGSGIGTKGQEKRTQNKTFAEIMALAPPPQFMKLQRSTGVMPGDQVGSDAARVDTPNFLSVKDEGSDYPSSYAGAATQKLGKAAGRELRGAFESLFANRREGPVGPEGRVRDDQSYSDQLRSRPESERIPGITLDTNVNYLGGGGGGSAAPYRRDEWGSYL